jgi:hypothetical protein
MRIRQRRMEEGTLQEQPEQGYGEREEKKPLPLRQVIFWLHLVAGVMAGLVTCCKPILRRRWSSTSDVNGQSSSIHTPAKC